MDRVMRAYQINNIVSDEQAKTVRATAGRSRRARGTREYDEFTARRTQEAARPNTDQPK
jgi:hypothetical protein